MRDRVEEKARLRAAIETDLPGVRAEDVRYAEGPWADAFVMCPTPGLGARLDLTYINAVFLVGCVEIETPSNRHAVLRDAVREQIQGLENVVAWLRSMLDPPPPEVPR